MRQGRTQQHAVPHKPTVQWLELKSCSLKRATDRVQELLLLLHVGRQGGLNEPNDVDVQVEKYAHTQVDLAYAYMNVYVLGMYVQ